jgi:hypothetical protein
LSTRRDDANIRWLLATQKHKALVDCIGQTGIDWRREIEHDKVGHEKR